jgi:outer membrane protein
MNCRTLVASILCLSPLAAGAEDLLTVYDRALVNDPQIREAEAIRRAAREGRPQAIASLLPQVSLSGNRTRDWSDGSGFQEFVFGTNAPIATVTGGDGVNDTKGWRLAIRQSVFSWANWATLKAASHQVAQAESNYVAARQLLAQRVAQQYFAVLAAQDVLAAQEAARDAFARQLEQAEKRFEVGLIAITDVQEARAARDSSAAAVIVAKRNLSNTEEVLRATVGEKYPSLLKPADDMPLKAPVPEVEDDWVKASMDQNATLISSRLAADIAREQVEVAFSGHLPTVDLVAGRSYTDSNGTRLLPDDITRTNNASETYGKSISLQVTLPLFSGGATQSRVRQSQYGWIAAKERLERTSRETERQARDAYLAVNSGISQVKALRQALESSRTALAATEAGYEVGTRTAVDVLESRRQLIQAQTNYAQARYAYLNSIIQLQLAAGDLDRDTIAEVNQWLKAADATAAPAATPAG